jgi:hypothetical protein
MNRVVPDISPATSIMLVDSRLLLRASDIDHEAVFYVVGC